MKTLQFYLLLSILGSYIVDAARSKGNRGSAGSNSKTKERGDTLTITTDNVLPETITNTFCGITIDGVSCYTNANCATGELCGTHQSDDSWTPLDDDTTCDANCNCYCVADESSINLAVEYNDVTDEKAAVPNDDTNDATNLQKDDNTLAIQQDKDDNTLAIQQDKDDTTDAVQQDTSDTDDDSVTITSKRKSRNSQKGGKNDDADDSLRKRNGSTKNKDDNDEDTADADADDNDSKENDNDNNDSKPWNDDSDSHDIGTTDSDSSDYDTTESADGDKDDLDNESYEMLAAVLHHNRMESQKVQHEMHVMVENIWMLIVAVVMINVGIICGWMYSKKTRKDRNIHRFESQNYTLTEQEDEEEYVVNVGSDENV